MIGCKSCAHDLDPVNGVTYLVCTKGDRCRERLALAVLDRIGDDAADALIAGMAAVVEWHPIETAPKDGTYVDVWTHLGEREAKATWVRGSWRVWGTDEYGSPGWEKVTGLPTHWTPIPPLPAGRLDRGGA